MDRLTAWILQAHADAVVWKLLEENATLAAKQKVQKPAPVWIFPMQKAHWFFLMRLLQSSWSTANLEFTVRTFNSTFTWVSLISTDCTLVWFHFLQEENELRTTLIFIDPKTRTACWYWCEAAHASVYCHLIAKTCESFQECVLSRIGYWKVKHICCTVIEINWVQRNMSEPLNLQHYLVLCRVSHWRANILAWSSAHTCPPSWSNESKM